ncbi:MAG: hypothetical protein Q4E82_05060 [Peptococcaceae bacterium]|nr:hypothetical protein [Peptococcaceae bacterium]
MIERLERIDELWCDIEDIMNEVQEYKDRATGVSVRPLSADGKGGTKDTVKLNAVERYIQVKTERLASKQRQLSRYISELCTLLDEMENRAARNAISQRYIMHRHPVDIAESLGYSEGYVYSLLREGKEELIKLTSKGGISQ